MEDIQRYDVSTSFVDAITKARKWKKNGSKENTNNRDDREDVLGYGDVTVFENAINRTRKGRRRKYQRPILIKVDTLITTCFWLTFYVKTECFFA